MQALPAHLGWGSTQFAAVLRDQRQSADLVHELSGFESEPDGSYLLRIVSKDQPLQSHSQTQQSIKAYPAILSAMLKHEQAAAGRVWLLCRHLDSDGRGWIVVDDLRRALTGKKKKAEGGRRKAENSSFIPHPSSFPVFGWRRLRQILGQGKGVFWDRDEKGRLWIFGAARVAANLGVERLQNRPIQLPVTALAGTMGQVRALFYAAFHAGRPEGQPISRATIAHVTGVPARTQFQYEETTGIVRRRNFTVTVGWGGDSAENAAYAHGNAVFQFIDHRGRHGKCGKRYVARQLPNSYTTTLQTCTRGRQRKVNARLADLVTRGAGERPQKVFAKLFYRSGNAVARVLPDTHHRQRLFWLQPADSTQAFGMWHRVGA